MSYLDYLFKLFFIMLHRQHKKYDELKLMKLNYFFHVILDLDSLDYLFNLSIYQVFLFAILPQ